MAFCLMAPNDYLNQWWLLLGVVMWHSPESNSIACAKATILHNDFKYYTSNITATSPMVNELTNLGLTSRGKEATGACKWMINTFCLFWLYIPRNYKINHTIFLSTFNTFRPRRNGCHFADNIFKYISMNEKFCILIQIPLKFVPKGLIDNKSALVQVMAWRRTGDKPLPESKLAQFTDKYMQH